MRIKIFLLLLITYCSLSAVAQTFNSKSQPVNGGTTRGSFGTVQPYTYQTGTICAIVSNTVTPVAAGKLDTLWRANAVDTGFVQFFFPNNLDILFDFAATKISGTVAGTVLLQGSWDNATWHTITGNTTYCTDCLGASGTVTNTTGTKHYPFYIPHSSIDFPYWQFRIITSDTSAHMSYTGTAGYKY